MKHISWIAMLLTVSILSQTLILPSFASDLTEQTVLTQTESVAYEHPAQEAEAVDEALQSTLPQDKQMKAVSSGEEAAGILQEEAAENLQEETLVEEILAAEPEEAHTSPVAVHNIPQYFQTDYPDVRYGSGTIATSGCSITCLAMVANYLTGHSYTPDELARYFGGRAINNMARMELGCETLQLPYSKNTNWHETYAQLQEGKIAIVLLGENSVFTETQHFVVLRGVTENGDVLVNDPNLNNYGRSNLVRGFAEGFPPGYIANGFHGGWVFDPGEMPQNPVRYYVPEPERPESRYPEIQLTQSQIELLAKIVWVEARGESAEGQQAVAEVVFNRMVSPNFSNTLEGVIFAEGQFRSVDFLDEAEPYQAQYEAIENALYGPYVLPLGVVHFATFQTNDSVWGKIGGHIFCYQS